MSAINGDTPLSARHRLAYARLAAREILRSALGRTTCGISRLLVNDLPANIKTPPHRGPSPFRLYQDVAYLSLLPKVCYEGDRVLDIGCGSGGNAYQFHAIGLKGTYVGIDLRPDEAWEANQALYTRGGLECRLQVLDAHKMERLGTFDVVFSSSALEHIPHIDDLVAKISRVTRAGGYSFHAVPGPWSYVLYGQHGFRRFSPAQLCSIFEGSGFIVEEIHALGGLPSFMLHWSCITLPGLLGTDLRRHLPRAYARFLVACVQWDRFLGRPHLGYVVIARRANGA